MKRNGRTVLSLADNIPSKLSVGVLQEEFVKFHTSAKTIDVK